MKFRSWSSLLIVIVLGACAAEKAPTPVAPLPPPRTHYMGREIAETMHWRGAEWLMRSTREDEEHATVMLDALRLSPGMNVCDLGCGNGYHTLRIAKRVAPGSVFAVDIQPEMLELLAERQREAGLDNVHRVLGSAADPKLEPASCDLVLMVDVYHELSYPELVLSRIREALRPDGRLVLVEFRAEDPEVPIKPLHKMSKAQMQREMAANGFTVAAEYDELPWQHVVFYEKGQDD